MSNNSGGGRIRKSSSDKSSRSSFVHLHVQSEYSLYESTVHLRRYVDEAKRRRLKHLAVSDNGNMFAAAEFYRLCLDAGIHPVIGCRFKMVPSPLSTDYAMEGAAIHLIAETTRGYRNLMQLSTHYNNGPLLTDALLKEYHEGLIALSGGVEGEISRLLLMGREEDARRRLRELEAIFGGENFFLEVQRHETANERQLNESLGLLSEQRGIPLVATHPVYYLRKEEALACRILRKIGSVDEKEVELDPEELSDQYYLKTEEEMCRLFSDMPEAIENPVHIAERCRVEIPARAPNLPKVEIPSDHPSSFEYLKIRAFDGLSRRCDPVPEEAYERLARELELVRRNGYVDYFLIVADYAAYARDRDIPIGPGRGAAAASLLSYAMEITDVDPLKYGLFSERFLNPEGFAAPDIDIDFCFKRRGEVVDYVKRKYGEDHAAGIITWARYTPRQAVRVAARTMGLSYSETERLVRKIPMRPGTSLSSAVEEVPELKEAISQNTPAGTILSIALVLEGLPTRFSTHAAGIVLSGEPLADFSPLYKDKKSGEIYTGYPAEKLEEIGPVKFDFLGFKVLTLLQRCRDKIRDKYFRDGRSGFFLSQIPDADDEAFRLLGKGETSGVFQCESSGMKDVLSKAKPQSIEELSALQSLYRPGGFDVLPEYIEAAHGGRKNTLSTELEGILSSTFGVPVYQEQIMEIVHSVAGWSCGKAELLRRSLKETAAQPATEPTTDVTGISEEDFLEDAEKNGYSKEDARQIFELLRKVSNYAFLKAHSIPYSLLAYRSAYLKTHYPEEYMSSLLEIEKDNPDRYEWYLAEAKKMNVAVE